MQGAVAYFATWVDPVFYVTGRMCHLKMRSFICHKIYMSFNKKKFWMAFSIWHTKMIPIACITQWISGTHSFELVIAFNPKLILPPKIGNKWLSRLSHLFFKLYFRFFGPNFLFSANFSNYLEMSKNLVLFVKSRD